MVHGSRFSETLSSVGNGRACLLHSLTETILQGCFYAAGLDIYLPPTPITAQHAPSHFIPPVCTSIVSSLTVFASSLLFCNQGAQGANPRLLHMADLCFSIPFASCCFSLSGSSGCCDHHVLWKYLDLFLLGGTQAPGFAARCKGSLITLISIMPHECARILVKLSMCPWNDWASC